MSCDKCRPKPPRCDYQGTFVRCWRRGDYVVLDSDGDVVQAVCLRHIDDWEKIGFSWMSYEGWRRRNAEKFSFEEIVTS